MKQLSQVIGRIHFRAPMQFMNQLPYHISYRVYDRTCGFDFGAALAPGAIAQLHFVNALHVIGMSLEVPDAGTPDSVVSSSLTNLIRSAQYRDQSHQRRGG